MLVHVVNGRRDDWSCEIMEKKKKEEVDHDSIGSRYSN